MTAPLELLDVERLRNPAPYEVNPARNPSAGQAQSKRNPSANRWPPNARSSIKERVAKQAREPGGIDAAAPAPSRTSHDAPFARSEVEDLLRLSGLPNDELHAALSGLDPADVVSKFRRMMVLSLGTRGSDRYLSDLQITLAAGLDEGEIRKTLGSYGPEKVGEWIRTHFPPETKKRLLPRLLPWDGLVDPRLSISGSGLMKSLEFQQVDKLIDDFLGAEPMRVHEEMNEMQPEVSDEALYWGMHPANLYTSYLDGQAALRNAEIMPGETVTDLGAGIGRWGLTLALAFPGVKYIGMECVEARGREAERIAVRNGFSQLDNRIADLSVDSVPESDVYVLYEPFSDDTLDLVLEQIRLIAEGRAEAGKTTKILAVGGRDILFTTLEDTYWLTEAEGSGEAWKCRIFGVWARG